jgi:hypothetical protein
MFSMDSYSAWQWKKISKWFVIFDMIRNSNPDRTAATGENPWVIL